MPIPNSNRKILEFVSISIEDETIVAKCDRDTRFSYIKKSLVKELNLAEYSLVLLKVTSGINSNFLIFESREELPFEIILGSYAINILNLSA